jgi:hypothetical protein
MTSWRSSAPPPPCSPPPSRASTTRARRGFPAGLSGETLALRAAAVPNLHRHEGPPAPKACELDALTAVMQHRLRPPADRDLRRHLQAPAEGAPRAPGPDAAGAGTIFSCPPRPHRSGAEPAGTRGGRLRMARGHRATPWHRVSCPSVSALQYGGCRWRTIPPPPRCPALGIASMVVIVEYRVVCNEVAGILQYVFRPLADHPCSALSRPASPRPAAG